jgi:hypothetical protein
MQNEATVQEIIDDKPDTVKSDLRKFNKAEQQVNKALAELGKITVVENGDEANNALDIVGRSKKVDKIIEEKRTSLVKPYNDEVKRINEYAKGLKEKLPPEIQRVSSLLIAYNKKEEERKLKLRTDSRTNQLASLDFSRDQLEGEWTLYRNGEISVDRFSIEHFDDQLWAKKVEQLVEHIRLRNQREIEALQVQKQADDFFGDNAQMPAIDQRIEELKAQPAVAADTHVPAFGKSSVKGLTKRWTFEVTDPSLVPREYLVVDETRIREAMNRGERNIPGVRFYQSESITSR